MDIKESPICVYPGCLEPQDEARAPWCEKHWGYYPHQCEEYGCERTVHFDDEPMCFTHSPDEGSSVRGYSAWKKAKAVQ